MHFNQIDKTSLKALPSAFVDPDYEISCDWNRYSTPTQSLNLIGKEYKKGKSQFKDPNDFFIVSLLVKKIIVRNIKQNIVHDPKQNIPEVIGSPNNRAHSLIKSEKNIQQGEIVKARLILSEICNWEIFDKEKLIHLKSSRK